MHQKTLREIAKIATGLVIADIISFIWLGGSGFFPLTLLGVTWPASSVLPLVVFDAALLILFIHWGWHVKLPVKSPTERTLLIVAGCLFFAVALLHLARLAFNWSLLLGGFAIPLWLSWVGFFVTAYLSYTSFHFARRTARK